MTQLRYEPRHFHQHRFPRLRTANAAATLGVLGVVAAVLPCYWVYAQVGLDLAERAGTVENHPYGTWVAAYADPAFQETTATAIELLDEAAEATDDATRTVMLETFADATRYEELFWERSHSLEAWTL